jgi:hypothetical protein
MVALKPQVFRLAVILVVTPTLLLGAAPPEYFFREDHLTGGFYLHLDAHGAYHLRAREHMGIFLFDEGTWSQKDTTLTFQPRDRKKRSYRGVLIETGKERALAWLDDQAPGMKLSAAEVTRQLKDSTPDKVPYVFFVISSATFAADLCGTYPFRFYPEMNQPPCGPEK